VKISNKNLTNVAKNDRIIAKRCNFQKGGEEDVEKKVG
jgi:hypothetical protein